MYGRKSHLKIQANARMAFRIPTSKFHAWNRMGIRILNQSTSLYRSLVYAVKRGNYIESQSPSCIRPPEAFYDQILFLIHSIFVKLWNFEGFMLYRCIWISYARISNQAKCITKWDLLRSAYQFSTCYEEASGGNRIFRMNELVTSLICVLGTVLRLGNTLSIVICNVPRTKLIIQDSMAVGKVGVNYYPFKSSCKGRLSIWSYSHHLASLLLIFPPKVEIEIKQGYRMKPLHQYSRTLLGFRMENDPDVASSLVRLQIWSDEVTSYSYQISLAFETQSEASVQYRQSETASLSQTMRTHPIAHSKSLIK